MGITVKQIEENEHFEYKGDVVVTGNIGKNATVIIKDGNLGSSPFPGALIKNTKL